MKDLKLQQWIQHILNFRLPIMHQVGELENLSGHGIEIGAGTCWLSSVLSKNAGLKKISAVEIDENRLALAKSFFVPYFKGDLTKIEFINADFHTLPFSARSIDFVVCDAALHHSDKLPTLLKEIERVLKTDGVIIAIREPILPSFFLLKIWRKMFFGWKQKLRGDIEKTYTKQQWKDYFLQAGLKIEFTAYFLNTTKKEKLVAELKKFNGMLFSRYILIGKLK